jgi:hypothetical protein
MAPGTGRMSARSSSVLNHLVRGSDGSPCLLPPQPGGVEPLGEHEPDLIVRADGQRTIGIVGARFEIGADRGREVLARHAHG